MWIEIIYLKIGILHRTPKVVDTFRIKKNGILHSSVYTFSNYRRVGRVSESVTRQIVLSVSGYG